MAINGTAGIFFWGFLLLFGVVMYALLLGTNLYGLLLCTGLFLLPALLSRARRIAGSAV